MEGRGSAVPLGIQVLAGAGGVVLLVGIVMLGLARLDNGTWGTLHGVPARVTMLGVAIMLGCALLNALRPDRDE